MKGEGEDGGGDEIEVHDSYRLVEGRFGDRVPIYWNGTCERIAIEAFLSGEWGLLTVDEIEFFRAARGNVARASPPWR